MHRWPFEMPTEFLIRSENFWGASRIFDIYFAFSKSHRELLKCPKNFQIDLKVVSILKRILIRETEKSTFFMTFPKSWIRKKSRISQWLIQGEGEIPPRWEKVKKLQFFHKVITLKNYRNFIPNGQFWKNFRCMSKKTFSTLEILGVSPPQMVLWIHNWNFFSSWWAVKLDFWKISILKYGRMGGKQIGRGEVKSHECLLHSFWSIYDDRNLFHLYIDLGDMALRK